MVSDDAQRQGWIRSVTGGLLICTLALAGCGADSESAGTVEPDGGESPAEDTAGDAGDGEGPGDDGSGADRDGEGAEPTPQPASSDGPGENLPVPEAPEEAYEDDLDGAEAALRHWFDLYEFARETGELDEIESFTHDECWPCEAHFDEVEDTYAGDGWYIQDSYELELVQLTELDSGAVGGPFILHEGDFEVYWDGEYEQSTEGARDSLWTARLVYEGDLWQVASLRFEMIADGDDEDGLGDG
ncbi:hypothetical protein GCM10027061_00500 [Nesterenkonia suensis]